MPTGSAWLSNRSGIRRPLDPPKAVRPIQSSKLFRVRKPQSAAVSALLCCALAVVCLSAGVRAAPQEPSGDPGASLTRIRKGLSRPAATRLQPSEPVQLRPTFRSETLAHPFVPTLEEDLRKTFALTDFQRRYAEYAAHAGGIDLGVLLRPIEKAMEEHRVRKIREQIARELAELQASKSAAR